MAQSVGSVAYEEARAVPAVGESSQSPGIGIDHEVDVLGRARLAVEAAGEGAGHHVADAFGVEPGDHLGEEVLGVHPRNSA
jgi:hypothetical protein